ncbi:MAG: hypothetical protein QOG38_2361 [Hyphomicrobiales bacterium]|jgi:hypothetical protein|nr:hypothetical protein [Hyphomicrobiales bacterium]
MRTSFIALAALLATVLADPAGAETRIFVIANNASGYGVDRCLAGGEPCGRTVATAYCQAQSFAQARSFRKVDRDEITGAVPTKAGTCHGADCDEFVAIECSR